MQARKDCHRQEVPCRGGGEQGKEDTRRDAQALFMGFFFEDYFPSLGWLDRLTGMRARLERNFSKLDGFYQEVIDEHRDPAWRWEEDRAEDAIDALLSIQKRGGANVTDEHIKGVLMVRA
ncbi:cytochrome P450 71A9-like [Iris pallida]|uniref:Cytochrome P450 71A9-like n=1 Tax=Iris pallida TaxID=29817 RepID=A0AAX6DP88_IRIPA|nr:cytochrome P450 71A9-like [Iris pallida]